METKKEGNFTYIINTEMYDKDSFINTFNEWKNRDDKSKTIGYIKGEDDSPNNITHIVENVEINDEVITGDYKILDTPRGKCIQELLKIVANDLYFMPKMIGRYNVETGKYEINQILSFNIGYKKI